MKFTTKGIQVIKSFGVGLFVPSPKDNELSKILPTEEYYDTAEMTRLIDCLCDECSQLGIRLEPPEYMTALLNDWGQTNDSQSVRNV